MYRRLFDPALKLNPTTLILHVSISQPIHSPSNPSMGTLKLHSNGPLYSNTVIGTLAVDGVGCNILVQRRGDWAESQQQCTL